MRCFSMMIGIALAAALAGGCSPGATIAVPKADSLVPSSVLAKASLSYYWEQPIDLKAGETIEKLWRLDEKLYAFTSANRLVALDAASGAERWRVEVTPPGRTVFAPCHADNAVVPTIGGIAALLEPPGPDQLDSFRAVIINTIDYALVIDRDSRDGLVKRKLEFKFVANSPGSCDGTRFYVGAVNGYYHAVRLSEGLVDWTMASKAMITVAPQTAFGTVYVASQDGKLYAVNPDALRERHVWTQTTDGPLVGDIAVDARGCFVPSTDSRIYAYDLATGETMWTFRTQGPLRRGIQVGAKSVFQYADKDRLYAIDLANGRKRWDLAEGRTVLAAVGDNALVLTDRRQLLLVNEILGKVEMSLPMNGLDLFVPNAAKPIIYAASREGLVVCIRPASAGHLTEEELKKRAK